MTKKQNTDPATEVDTTAEDATPAAEYTPAIVRDEDLDYTANGRAPIELDEVLGSDDLDKLFAQAAPKPVVVEAVPDAIDPPAEVPAGNPEREAQLQAEVEAQKNNFIRTLADFQNYRRRTDEEIKRIKGAANERLIKEVLPIVDDFELSLVAAQKAQSYEQLVGGVEAVLRKFVDILAKEGVTAIPAVGEPFNPDVHDAVMVEEDSDAPSDTVTAELRKGYTLNGRVIRPALVKVSKS